MKAGLGNLLNRCWSPALVAIVLYALSTALKSYWLYVASITVIYAIAAVGVSLLFGRIPKGGHPVLMSFGQSIFLAIGAYGTTIAQQSFHTTFLVGALLSILLAVVVAAAIAVPACRLGPFGLALVTFVCAFAATQLIDGSLLRKFTGGETGITISPGSIGSWNLSVGKTLYVVAAVVLVVAMLMADNLQRSQRWQALRFASLNESVASTLGVRVLWLRTQFFCVAAAYAAVAGALLGQALGQLSPATVNANASVDLATMAVLGGSGTALGPLVGALIFKLPPVLFSDLGTNVELFVAVILLAMLILAPQGILGLLEDLVMALRRRYIQQPRMSTMTLAPPVMIEPHGLPDTKSPIVSGAGEFLLEVENLGVEFDGVKALDNVSIRVMRGTIHGLIGPNGAGKTTLLNAINRIVPTSSGSISLNGNQLRLKPSKLVRLGVSRTFQHPHLLDDASVLENVAFGLYTSSRTWLFEDLLALPTIWRRAARRRRLATATIEALGLGSVAHLRAGDLSYGVRKLVDLARAWVSEPKLLLLDEPTAGLNESEIERLGEFLKSIRCKATIIVIVHHIEFISAVADVITVLNWGRKLTEGTPAHVRQDPAVIDAYIGVSV